MLQILKKNIVLFKFSSQFRFKDVIIDYSDLQNQKNLEKIIETAYGTNGYGILFVKNVPNYVQSRKKTLPLNWKIAHLPQQTLKKYQINSIPHRGWHILNSDNNPVASYYFNAIQDHPVQIKQEHLKYFTEEQIKKNPKNFWVDEIPEFQKNIKGLCKIIIKTGRLLAKQIDRYAINKIPNYQKNYMVRVVDTGFHTGRALHYFPYQNKGKQQGDWLWWHNDFGNLTGLTSSMYIDQNGNEVEELQDGGLYAKNRSKQKIKIKIPKDMIAYQIGQCAQIMTGGKLIATPHCVIKSTNFKGKQVSRQTLAVFMEPNLMDSITVPKGIKESEVLAISDQIGSPLSGRWKNGMLFKQMLHNSLKIYHDDGYKQKEAK